MGMELISGKYSAIQNIYSHFKTRIYFVENIVENILNIIHMTIIEVNIVNLFFQFL